MHAWAGAVLAWGSLSACGFISRAAIKDERITANPYLAWLGNLAVSIADERRDDTVE